ncbi:MAG: aminodeoxychorismate lyase [Gammaproteobacteria bacterium]|nr:aminodeoxychorismate lyase [Gammaproteobacteria bacterium]MBU1625170.1 aminodeoxychorismate lyase [Gammaproteobacteria bacterium]MBU1981430.1 aminodeoxychorismate lyase [Gammaproteobacteria bacterium]
MLVNGKPADTISVADRGLSYGDGVFRTLRIQQGSPFCWHRQYDKLRHDCQALGITCPDEDMLLQELKQLSGAGSGIAKITVTRGIGKRGYAPSSQANPTRVVSFHPAPKYDEALYVDGITPHLCDLKLSRQPRLAGLKHLNRLENVLAAGECQAAGAVEGLLEDEDGFVISGTRSNLFAVSGGKLSTPDLSASGVAGVQRDRVIAWAAQHGVECTISRMKMTDLLEAEELFLVNSVFGLWPIARLHANDFSQRQVSFLIQTWLNDAQN